MEAVDTLIRFGKRLHTMREASRREEGKQLLQWVGEGGLQSLEAGLEAFLIAAIDQPAGSTFYDDDDDKLPRIG